MDNLNLHNFEFVDAVQGAEAVARGCSVKKVFLKFCKIHRKKPGPACNVIKKENLVQVFYCEFCEIFRSTIFMEYLLWLLLKVEHQLVVLLNQTGPGARGVWQNLGTTYEWFFWN